MGCLINEDNLLPQKFMQTIEYSYVMNFAIIVPPTFALLLLTMATQSLESWNISLSEWVEKVIHSEISNILLYMSMTLLYIYI